MAPRIRLRRRYSRTDNETARQIFSRVNAAGQPINNILTRGVPVMGLEAAFAGTLKAAWWVTKTAVKGLWTAGKYAASGATRGGSGGGSVLGGFMLGANVTATAGWQMAKGFKSLMVRNVRGTPNPLTKGGAMDWAHAAVVNAAPVLALVGGVKMGTRSAELNASIGKVNIAQMEDSFHMGVTPHMKRVHKDPLVDVGASGDLAFALHHLRQG